MPFRWCSDFEWIPWKMWLHWTIDNLQQRLFAFRRLYPHLGKQLRHQPTESLECSRKPYRRRDLYDDALFGVYKYSQSSSLVQRCVQQSHQALVHNIRSKLFSIFLQLVGNKSVMIIAIDQLNSFLRLRDFQICMFQNHKKWKTIILIVLFWRCLLHVWLDWRLK